MNVPEAVRKRIAHEIRKELACDIEYGSNGKKLKVRIYEIERLIEYICQIFQRGVAHGTESQKKAMIQQVINSLSKFN